jgi:dTDP-4-dehydrorhamnose reductase
MSARPRLLVIGARGFLGGHLVTREDERFQSIGAGRRECEVELDITDAASVERAFESVQPKIVVLAAAMADIDACERDPVRSFQTNVAGARTVAQACAKHSTRLLFASSGAVFDGTAAAYRETDPPSPLSVYGSTKAEAEGVVMGLLRDAIVVRLSLVLGMPVWRGTNSLMERLRDAFQKGKPVSASVHEHRNAIDAETAAQWILDLAAAPDARGVFHLGSSDAPSRYEIVRTMAEAMGYSADMAVPDEDAPRRAPRGRHHLLLPERVGRFSRVAVPTCREAIERCVHALA